MTSETATHRRFRLMYFLAAFVLLSIPPVIPAGKQQGDKSSEAGAGECITLADFGEKQVGEPPKDWKMLTFGSDGGIKPSEYRVVEMNGDYVLRCRTASGSSALFKEIDVDPERYPYIAWRWRIETTFPRGDGTRQESDDYPARLYMAFRYDASRVSYWTQLKFRMAKGESEYEGYPPLWALNYVWANKLRRNTWLPNPWEQRSKMVAVRRGKSGVGKWHWEVRNYRKDFRAIVGEKPTPLKFVAVMIDGDNTDSRGTCYVGPIQLWSELPSRFEGKVPPAPRRYHASGEWDGERARIAHNCLYPAAVAAGTGGMGPPFRATHGTRSIPGR